MEKRLQAEPDAGASLLCFIDDELRLAFNQIDHSTEEERVGRYINKSSKTKAFRNSVKAKHKKIP